ncbi:MAG: pantoate--beta-alanine ligase [Acidimicrobiia bacterium]|nr:pantoate--beta-alanine ligase [Acidimicrobiia bacterium]
MKIIGTFAETRALATGAVGLVPTMGFLHEGHVSLMERARRVCDTLVASLYVNPTQFDERGDFDRYPRDLDRDAAIAAAAGVDILFAPDDDEMYPNHPVTAVSLPALTDRMEGAHRPGHFEGVATVVAKLLAGIQPQTAFFGRKDAQQLAVISSMAADLSFPVDIVGGSIVREHDGLALSSRNIFIENRDAACTLSSALMTAADAYERGVVDGAELESLVVETVKGADVEYVELADARTTERLVSLDRPAFLAIAARVGSVRLIDNVFFSGSPLAADRGTNLDAPSLLYGQGDA